MHDELTLTNRVTANVRAGLRSQQISSNPRKPFQTKDFYVHENAVCRLYRAALYRIYTQHSNSPNKKVLSESVSLPVKFL